MPIFQQTHHVLGSTGLLTFVTESQTQTDELFAELWHQIEAFEARFSRFRADSELVAFNHAAGKRTQVSQAFRTLLSTAKDYSLKTEGLFNPLLLPALQRAGYAGSWPKPGTVATGTDFRGGRTAEAEQIQIGDDWAMIPKDNALDFGGIGKGYMLDQLAAYLDGRGIADYWLSLGGDIICRGHEPGSSAWTIDIQHAHKPGQNVGAFANTGQGLMAVATSGTAKRKGEGWHHLIDPRTDKPAETDIITATVRAKTGTEADILAKCAVIVGRDKAPTLCEQHGGEAIILQSKGPGNTIIVKEWGNNE